MRKQLLILTLSFLCLLGLFSAEAFSQSNNIIIKKGTFLKVMSERQISTQEADIDDGVSFINAYDMYVEDTNAIPQNSVFYGIIEDLKEPVQGTNGALKIKITKFITPDKRTVPIDGYIYNENDNYIGGELTAPMYYSKTPHYIEGFGGGVLQYSPVNIRHPGKHTVIKPGAELFLILNSDLKIN